MKRSWYFPALATAISWSAVFSAWPQELPPPVARKVDFAQEVHPILAEHCAKCHLGGKRKGGLSLETREEVLKGGEAGAVVVPGDSGASRLIALVGAVNPEEVMPPQGRRLSAEEVGILRAWIDQGLAWTEIQKEDEYVAPLHLQQPDAAMMGEAGNFIDRYLETYYAKQGVTPPPRVDDAVFLRRASLDATGLLPDAGRLQTFLADANAEKRVALVDALLGEARAYAEHWMSFWNDVLRNDFEGTGYIDGGRKQITDWLYLALYRNMPYDEMVRGLIAPNPMSEGFINGIVWRGDNAAVQTAPMQAARNVAQVFLGVNLKCASCHDSFIDHWQLDDAYSLANCFSESPMELVRCEVPTGRAASYRFLWPELGEIDATAKRRERMAQVAALTVSRENGHFARTIVNRYWALLMGRGLVEPVDSIEKRPWYPELLDALAWDFVEHGYDLKHLLRRIMTSAAYGAVAHAAPEQEAHPYVFSGPVVRRLTAEQFYDAIGQISGVWQANPKFVMPEDRTPEEEQRQAKLRQQLAGGKNEPAKEDYDTLAARRAMVRAWRVPADPLMRAMGRTNREQVTTRREWAFTTLQSLELSNGTTLNTYLGLAAESLLERFAGRPDALIEHVYYNGLQRGPTETEVAIARDLLASEGERDAVQDFLWVVAMQPDFALIM